MLLSYKTLTNYSQYTRSHGKSINKK